MEQYETNVTVVMDFLKSEHFSHSVLCVHKLCYQELRSYLKQSGVVYSSSAAYQWIEANQSVWSYRKYTSWRHCIDQLEDVYASGQISPDNLSPRKSAYAALNESFKAILDDFISGRALDDDRYRISCSRFLLFLQDNSVGSIQELGYGMLIKFHYTDHHRSSKSKDVYEDLIRTFLRYLAEKGLCTYGFSLVLNRLLIHQVISVSSEELCSIADGKREPALEWNTVMEFLKKMAETGYGSTVLKTSRHILTLLYIFLDMHHTMLSESLVWFWFEKVKPLLGNGWKQHRRTLCQFLGYLDTAGIKTCVTGDPFKISSLDQLPLWAKEPLSDYLNLLKREGWQPSTISMQRSSNLRFCRYLETLKLERFSDMTPVMLKDFHLQDKHMTPESKAAYNCRIRSFIIYLYEQKLIADPYLYKALPACSAPRTPLIQTLSKEEVQAIWEVDLDGLSPKALRDYAMVCIGLTMGFRASDICSLRFENVDWKQRSISIIQQKTGRLLKMPMPVRTGNILFRYLRDGRPSSTSPYIFIRHEAPYDRIQQGVCRNALGRFIPPSPDGKNGFHRVRKTFATQLLEGNTDVELISELLGHSDDSTVHKYLALDAKRIRMCPLSLVEAGIPYKGGAFHA